MIYTVNMTSHTAYSIDARQTLDKTDRSRVDWYAEHMIDVAPKLKTLGIKYLAADSYYSKKICTRRHQARFAYHLFLFVNLSSIH